MADVPDAMDDFFAKRRAEKVKEQADAKIAAADAKPSAADVTAKRKLEADEKAGDEEAEGKADRFNAWQYLPSQKIAPPPRTAEDAGADASAAPSTSVSEKPADANANAASSSTTAGAAAAGESDDDMPPGMSDFFAKRRKGAAAEAVPAPEPEPEEPELVVVAESCSMQGRMPKQEDRHVKIPDLTKAAKAFKMPIDHLEQPCAFYSIYDGHRGNLCSDFVAKSFHSRILKRLSADTSPESWTDERIQKELSEVFEQLDVEFLAKNRTSNDGCTLAVALQTGNRVHLAWIGDARCLSCTRSASGIVEAVALTEEHLASLPAEADRVKLGGGAVVNFAPGVSCVVHAGYEERMREIQKAQAQGLGQIFKEPIALSVSRALGDRDFKAVTGKAVLIATPSTRTVTLDRSHKALILLTGSLSEAMLDDEIARHLDVPREAEAAKAAREAKTRAERSSLARAADARAGCGSLVQEVYNRGSQDNLTVILVRLAWKGDAVSEAAMRRRAAGLQAAADAEAAAAAEADKSKQATSKRRRVETAANINKQKVAAYEKALASAASPEPNAARAPSPPRVVAVKAVEKVKTWNQLKVEEETASGDLVKPAAPVKVAEPVKTAEPLKPAETVKVAEPVKPAAPVKVAEPVKSAQPVKAAVAPASEKTESKKDDALVEPAGDDDDEDGQWV